MSAGPRRHSSSSARRGGRRSRSARSRGRTAIALTGTPGVGKSAVARRLADRWAVVEVADLARRTGTGRPVRGGVEVDLRRLRAVSGQALVGIDVVVGHLAHLLPVRRAIVLRCHPRELSGRLARSRRGSASERRANVVCEAIGLIAWEAARRRCIVEEVDTSRRPVADVAREVDQRLRRLPRSGAARIDWLADPSVTAHLLDGTG